MTLFYSGFALDASGNLYLGKDARIEKYAGDTLVGTIDPRTSRGYAFTIQGDDTLLVSTGTTVYTLDLTGNERKHWDDSDMDVFIALNERRTVFTASNGRQYFMKWQFGRTKIVDQRGQALYQMPLRDYIVKIVLFLVGASFFVFVPIIIVRSRK